MQLPSFLFASPLHALRPPPCMPPLLVLPSFPSLVPMPSHPSVQPSPCFLRRLRTPSTPCSLATTRLPMHASAALHDLNTNKRPATPEGLFQLTGCAGVQGGKDIAQRGGAAAFSRQARPAPSLYDPCLAASGLQASPQWSSSHNPTNAARHNGGPAGSSSHAAPCTESTARMRLPLAHHPPRRRRPACRPQSRPQPAPAPGARSSSGRSIRGGIQQQQPCAGSGGSQGAAVVCVRRCQPGCHRVQPGPREGGGGAGGS